MTAARVLFMFRLFKSQRDVRQFQHPLAVRRPAGRFSQARFHARLQGYPAARSKARLSTGI
jgi:hypothetical protein